MPAPVDAIQEWAADHRGICIVCDGHAQPGFIICKEHMDSWIVWLAEHGGLKTDDMFREWFFSHLKYFCAGCEQWHKGPSDYLCDICRSEA